MGSRLKEVAARYESIHGTMESSWTLNGHQLQLSVTIPANTRARVYVPCSCDCCVLENGMPARLGTAIEESNRESGFAVFLVESGNYNFTATID